MPRRNEPIEAGQAYVGHGFCEGMALVVVEVPRSPRPLEVRFTAPAWATFGTQSMTRTWLRRYYKRGGTDGE